MDERGPLLSSDQRAELMRDCKGCASCESPDVAFAACMERGGRKGESWCNRPRNHIECGAPCRWENP